MRIQFTAVAGILVAAACMAASASAANLLTNSGFEVCTVESLPDYWGNGRMGISAPRWVLDADSWRAHWGVVDTTSHSGKRSLRIHHVGDGSDLSLHARWVDIETLNVPYTLSFWLKSDRPDMPVSFGFMPPHQTVKVGTDWTRYSVTASPYDKTLTIVLYLGAEGVLWIDDAQFEVGSEPTAHAPSPSDASLTGEAVQRSVADIKPYPIKPGKAKPPVVAIDQHRRFLVDGVPFIPFATGWETLPSREVIEDSAKAGFNSIFIYVGNNDAMDAVRKVLDDANSFGLRVIVGMSGGITTNNRAIFHAGLRSHPALIAWNVRDEPGGDYPEVTKAYELAKRMDPAHPAYVNYAPGFYMPKVLPTDISSLDQYTIGCGGSPLTQAINVDSLEALAIPAGKPSWIWLQASGNAYWLSREPTAPEEEAMVYLCLIHGARGIKFWVTKPPGAELWKEMKILAREIRQLTPILYSAETAGAVSALPSGIHLVGKTYQGRQYIVAANSLPTPVDAQIAVSGGKTANVLFEKRRVKVMNGAINDTFLGYQRHVYEVR